MPGGVISQVYSEWQGKPLLTSKGEPRRNIVIGGEKYGVFDTALFPLLAQGAEVEFDFSVSGDGKYKNITSLTVKSLPGPGEAVGAAPAPAGEVHHNGKDMATQESIVRQTAIKAAAEIVATSGYVVGEHPEEFVKETGRITLELAERFRAWAFAPYELAKTAGEREAVTRQVMAVKLEAGKLVKAGFLREMPVLPDREAPIAELLAWVVTSKALLEAATLAARIRQEEEEKAKQGDPWAGE